MENAVAIELQRKKFDETEVYYWRDYQQNKVDFVVKSGAAVKQLIQVTHASSGDEIRDRELKSLLKASRELRCKNMLVIT